MYILVAHVFLVGNQSCRQHSQRWWIRGAGGRTHLQVVCLHPCGRKTHGWDSTSMERGLGLPGKMLHVSRQCPGSPAWGKVVATMRHVACLSAVTSVLLIPFFRACKE